MKNLGERSVRVPDRVKRGCTPPKTTIKRQKKTSHYKYNVTHHQNTHQKKTHTPPKSHLQPLYLSYFTQLHTNQTKRLQAQNKYIYCHYSIKRKKRFFMFVFCLLVIIDTTKYKCNQITNETLSTHYI